MTSELGNPLNSLCEMVQSLEGGADAGELRRSQALMQGHIGKVGRGELPQIDQKIALYMLRSGLFAISVVGKLGYINIARELPAG